MRQCKYSANTREKIYSISEYRGLMSQRQFDKAKSLLANIIRSFRNGEVDSRELIDNLMVVC
jgi:F0F1-type ATP synthase gamma subunit